MDFGVGSLNNCLENNISFHLLTCIDMRTYMLLLLVSLLYSYEPLVAQSDITIRGKIKDEKGEGIPFVNIVLKQNGVFVKGTQSDFDGYYEIGPLKAGKYELEASCVGMMTLRVESLVVAYNIPKMIDYTMSQELMFPYAADPIALGNQRSNEVMADEDFSDFYSIVDMESKAGNVWADYFEHGMQWRRQYYTGLVDHHYIGNIGLSLHDLHRYTALRGYVEPSIFTLTVISTERKNRLATDRDVQAPRAKLPTYDPLEGDDTLHY
jgi:hypothetical protein